MKMKMDARLKLNFYCWKMSSSRPPRSCLADDKALAEGGGGGVDSIEHFQGFFH
jgi:hypothetical protein